MIRRFTGMLVLALTLSAGAMAADMQKLSQEVQRVSQTPERMSLVWWMPTAFWETALNSNPALTPEGRAQVLTALDEYTVFAMLRAKIGAGGVTEATSKEDLVSNSRLEVDGKTIEPVSAESIKPATQAILAGFKPALAGTLGSLGQSIEIVVYPGKVGDRKLLDPMKPGAFTFTLFDQTFKWRLPLGSLLPPKLDPKTSEEFPGNYDFNPFTGGKLRAK